MKIHEYQAKELLKRSACPCARDCRALSRRSLPRGGRVACSPVVSKHNTCGRPWQSGGVKLAKNPDEAREIAKQILGMNLITHQTGRKAKKSRAPDRGSLPIDKEFYLGIVLIERADVRCYARPPAGMDIEEVAAKTPEKIFKKRSIRRGFPPFQARKLAFARACPPSWWRKRKVHAVALHGL